MIRFLQTALQEQYKSAVQERSFMRALNRLVNSNQVEIGSPIYIITDSAIADPDSFTESIYNLIAQKHLTASSFESLGHFDYSLDIYHHSRRYKGSWRKELLW